MKLKTIRLNKKKALLLVVGVLIAFAAGLFVLSVTDKDDARQNDDKIAKLSDEGALAAEADNYDLAITKAKEKLAILKDENQRANTATEIASYYFARGNKTEGGAWMDRAIGIYQSQNNREKAESASNLKKKFLVNNAGGVID